MLEITIWDIQKNTFIAKEIMFTGIPRRAQALDLALKRSRLYVTSPNAKACKCQSTLRFPEQNVVLFPLRGLYDS